MVVREAEYIWPDGDALRRLVETRRVEAENERRYRRLAPPQIRKARSVAPQLPRTPKRKAPGQPCYVGLQSGVPGFGMDYVRCIRRRVQDLGGVQERRA